MTRSRQIVWSIVLLAGLVPALVVAAAAPTDGKGQANVDSRDVRPILSAKCFKCHGHDEATRAADLRLDTREGLFADLGGYSAFAPGDIESSEAWRRVTSDDEFERMPPPAAKKELTPGEIDILRRWIEQGAPWEPHWAFVPPSRPAVPPASSNELSGDDRCRNPIDRFVRARLAAESMPFSPEADRYTLARRVYLDLIGLPPTPEQADAFARDESPDAYERLVDRLLADPRYGERWARKWLDLARYADTNGYEKDRDRSIWPWRDWVVDAINAGMPFDEFTVKQLAGDLLPDATIEDRIATGFHRNTMLNEEGGIDPLEFRFHAMTDRVATTGTTWLGLTTGCAQCHDHKYDPISQREYYGLMAFLNNADEPDLAIPDASADAAYARNLAEANRLLAALPAKWPAAGDAEGRSADERFALWLEEARRESVAWKTLRPTAVSSNLPLLEVQDDDSVFASGDTTKQDRYEIDLRPDTRGVVAIRLEALPDDRLPAGGPGMTYYEGTIGDFFLTEVRVSADGAPLEIASASHSYAKNRFGNNPATAEMAIDGDYQTGWSVDGRIGQRHTAVFRFASPVDAEALHLTMTFGRHFASSLGRFRLSVATEPGATARDLSEDVERLLTLSDDELTDADRDRLREEFLLQAPEFADEAAKIRKLRTPPASPSTLVFRERPPENPRPTFIHHRGEFLQPTEEVEPVSVEALHPLADGRPRNRLGLARWLMADDNPLTARVIVNRHWAIFFGRGLTPSVQDFGFQGEPPSHPELLDWLAVELIESGWDLKALHRAIVTSATYRQSSAIASDLRDRDPENVLLGRGPRGRLDAEIIRDSALAASGLLAEEIGGPPVRPPQPTGVTEAAYGSPKWNADEGADRYRRSLYTFQKRTAPFAMYAVFDAPSGESCTARRDVSNTALQALTLVNDPMFQEAAQALGSALALRDGTDDERAAHALRRVLVRPPLEAETARVVAFALTQRERFASGALDPRPIVGEEPTNKKEVPRAGDGDLVERAVWTTVARALLSLDEAISKN